jgi:hypothetical protein
VLYLGIYCILVLVEQYLGLTCCRYCKKGFELMFYSDMDFLYLQLVSVCSQWLFILILTLDDKFHIFMIYGMWINEWMKKRLWSHMLLNKISRIFYQKLSTLLLLVQRGNDISYALGNPFLLQWVSNQLWIMLQEL